MSVERGKPEHQKTVGEKGIETYRGLKRRGLNLINPRPAEDSLNPDAPRTLLDLLGESDHRARILVSQLAKKPSPGATSELNIIIMTWKGFEAGALKAGDARIANFIRYTYINPVRKIRRRAS